MEGYIVDDEIINIIDGVEYISYCNSIHQLKRKQKVLRQLISIWNKVYNTLKHIREYNNIDDIMKRVYKLWMIEYKSDINYYGDDMIKNRSKPIYKIKKLNKLKSRIYII